MPRAMLRVSCNAQIDVSTAVTIEVHNNNIITQYISMAVTRVQQAFSFEAGQK